MVCRALLGMVFISSGALKIISPQNATELLSQVSLLGASSSRIVVLLGSILELLLGGTLLVAGKYLRHAAVISSSALLIFIFVGIQTLDNPRPCGCFGDMLDSMTDEYFILRNIVLLLISMFILRYSTGPIATLMREEQ
jgi:uncharacterized membrane protein YphA (DoxX/SURF4 family)